MFAEILKESRKFKGLTQVEMAKMLNISTTSYGDYERGKNEPSLSTLKELSRILEVSIDYLLNNRIDQINIDFETRQLIANYEKCDSETRIILQNLAAKVAKLTAPDDKS